jgi:hypothetical protein
VVWRCVKRDGVNVPERKRFCPLRDASLSVENLRTGRVATLGGLAQLE